jgi:hypothetical protein
MAGRKSSVLQIKCSFGSWVWIVLNIIRFLVVIDKLFYSVIVIVSAKAGFKLREYVALNFAGWLE